MPESSRFNLRPPAGLVLALVLACTVLAGCAEEGESDDDRRFANQPVTEVPTATTEFDGASSTPKSTTESPTTQRSPFDVRGAPAIVHAVVGGTVLAIDTAQDNTIREFPPQEGMMVIDLVSSANGQKVALLEIGPSTTPPTATVRVLQADGAEIQRWDLDWPEIGTATPAGMTGDERSLAGTLSWSASGESLLVSMAGESLVSLGFDGEITVVEVPSNVQTIVDAAESPLGSTIAVLDQDEAGNGRIMLINPGADTPAARQVVPPTADTGGQGSVSQFAWLPNGSGFAYVMVDDLSAGALYVQQANGGQRQLLATPGQGGPAARIVDFSLSPQGDVVSYVIGTPNDDSMTFNSLWVRRLSAPGATRIATTSTEPVQGMWWTDRGLAWLQGTESLAIVGPDGNTASVALAPAPPEGTPGASPVASPVMGTPEGGSMASTVVATPIASPLPATPIASPTAASPVASPVG